MIEIYLIFALLLPLSLCEDTYCPNATLVSPCTCHKNSITCGGDDYIDLPRLFDTLSTQLQPQQKQFKSFVLENKAINELKDNTFKDITFEAIVITNATNLQTIDVNAFRESVFITKRLHFINNPILSQTENNSLFEMLSKFAFIEEIFLIDNNITEIPDNAFMASKLIRVMRMTFSGLSLKRLGNNAFEYLVNLDRLNISGTDISHIPENGFNFINDSNIPIKIYLNDNHNIRGESFAPKSLSSLRRPAYLDLSSVANTTITHLDESVFKPFIDTDPDNQINVKGQAIDCSDCRNYWLKRQESNDKVIHVLCSNGKHINDKTNFAECHHLKTNK